MTNPDGSALSLLSLTFSSVTELSAVGPPRRVRPPVNDKHLRVGRLRWQEIAHLEVVLLLRADLKERIAVELIPPRTILSLRRMHFHVAPELKKRLPFFFRADPAFLSLSSSPAIHHRAALRCFGTFEASSTRKGKLVAAADRC